MCLYFIQFSFVLFRYRQNLWLLQFWATSALQGKSGRVNKADAAKLGLSRQELQEKRAHLAKDVNIFFLILSTFTDRKNNNIYLLLYFF
jgi:hypothetical protein